MCERLKAEMLREIYCKIVIIVFQLNAGRRKNTIEKLMSQLSVLPQPEKTDDFATN